MNKIIKIKVIPKAKQNRIEKLDDNNLKVYLTTVPEKGKANQSLIKLLAKYFKTAKNNIEIIKGQNSREKIIKIN